MKFNELETSTQVILKVIFAGLILAFLWLIRDILLILLISLILASAMEPMVDYFSEKRVPRAVSVLAVYALVLASVTFVVYLLVPPVIGQMRVLAERWPDYALQLERLIGNTSVSVGDIGNYFKQFSDSYKGGLLTGTVSVFNAFFTLITVLVISFYLVAEDRGMKKFISTLLPVQHRDFAVNLIDKIQKKMGMWVIGQVILSVSIFILAFIGLSLLRVDYALFLALLAGILEVVPYIGPFLSAVPGVFFAFIQNPPLALAVAIMYLIIQKTEGYVLVPKVMEKTVGTSPLVVLLALLTGFQLAGIVGLLIAVPIVSALTVIINEFLASGKEEKS
ncbi:MAG: AI-2E family transporter [Patescibacteria group bacterium]|nr:AI-2E family transporter [Patescibacteria group bacterium]